MKKLITRFLLVVLATAFIGNTHAAVTFNYQGSIDGIVTITLPSGQSIKLTKGQSYTTTSAISEDIITISAESGPKKDQKKIGVMDGETYNIQLSIVGPDLEIHCMAQ